MRDEFAVAVKARLQCQDNLLDVVNAVAGPNCTLPRHSVGSAFQKAFNISATEVPSAISNRYSGTGIYQQSLMITVLALDS